jgi:hypothetical protein
MSKAYKSRTTFSQGMADRTLSGDSSYHMTSNYGLGAIATTVIILIVRPLGSSWPSSSGP